VNSIWGAESKDPDDAYLVDAVRTFSTTQTREHDSPLRLLMLLNAKIQVVGAKLKRACMAAQDVDVAAVHSKTLPFLLSAPGKNRGGPPGAGFGGGKGTNGMGRTSSPGVLRLRAPSAVSCDESVRRFAQDDDFVGVLKKKIP
jgi:hypothetical protein